VEVLRSAFRHDVEKEDIQKLYATHWSSRRSQKTRFGNCFSALIGLEDFLSWS
jgi:hypothetical protein